MISPSPVLRSLPVIVCILAASGTARAAASARLVYVRGPGGEPCPGEQAVRGAVAARLGYDPFFPWARDTLFAEITRSDRLYRVELKLVDGDNLLRGAREISVQAEDCAPAVDAMGLTISLTIDPASVLGEQHPAPAPSRPPPLVAEAEPSVTPVAWAGEEGAHSTPRARESATFHVGAGIVASFDAAPSPSVGTTISAGAAWRFLSLDLEGRADVPATGDGEVPAAKVRSWLLVASAVPCVHAGGPFACLVLGGGAYGATSVGVAAPRDDQAPWWAAGLRAGSDLPLGRAFSLRAYAQLLAVLTRNSLTIDHAVVYRSPPWTGGLGTAIAWRFP